MARGQLNTRIMENQTTIQEVRAIVEAKLTMASYRREECRKSNDQYNVAYYSGQVDFCNLLLKTIDK